MIWLPIVLGIVAIATCGDVPEPACFPRGVVPFGTVTCSKQNFVGSICNVVCDEGRRVLGHTTTICKPSLHWSFSLPDCTLLTCPKIGGVPNGRLTCNNQRYVGSVCRVSCKKGFRRYGSRKRTCLLSQKWSNPLATCEANLPCPKQDDLINGRMSCTNDFELQSTCTFACNMEGYIPYPTRSTSQVCMPKQRWNVPMPSCCAAVCPPNAVADVLLVLDSSSSLGAENWALLIDFVEGTIRQYKISPDAVNVAIFRYNSEVDQASQVLLNSYSNGTEGVVAALKMIPYDGTGTDTGEALNHALTVSLTEANGNRPGAKDIVIVFTDGKAADDVKTPADAIRSAGAQIIVVGIEPLLGQLDIAQLEEIAGSGQNVIIPSGGFDGLSADLQGKINDVICGDMCSP